MRASTNFGASHGKEQKTQQPAENHCVLEQRSARVFFKGWLGGVSECPYAIGYLQLLPVGEQRFIGWFVRRRAEQVGRIELGAVIDEETHVIILLGSDLREKVTDSIRAVHKSNQSLTPLSDAVNQSIVPVDGHVDQEAFLLDGEITFLDQSHTSRCGRLAGITRGIHRLATNFLRPHIKADRVSIEIIRRLQIKNRVVLTSRILGPHVKIVDVLPVHLGDYVTLLLRRKTP